MAVASVALALAAPKPASAQAAPPTAEQLEQAKALYLEGKALYDAKKLPEAIAKFRDSYRLSRNPVLLFNIAVTLEENGQKESALNFYRKFLSDAPKDALQRPQAEAAVANLELALLDSIVDPPSGDPPVGDPPTGDPPVADPPPETPAIKIKPPGTYKDTDFQHQVVDEAPPGKPLDVTAYAPEDSGWQVTLFYRAAGEDQFTPKLMKPRYKELVARIPAAKVTGSSLQYYVDVKDQAGAMVTRIGKPSSPNIVYVDAAASARFYPDWSDSDDARPATGGNGGGNIDDENPLGGPGPGKGAGDGGGGGTIGGPVDAPSSKLTYARWGATGGAAALLSLSLVFYIRAGNANSTLQGEADASQTETCQTGNPCREFDAFLADAQATGESAETWSKVTFGLGLAAAGAAGYLWYRHLKAKGRDRVAPATARRAAEAPSWVAVPAITEDGVGAAALVRF